MAETARIPAVRCTRAFALKGRFFAEISTVLSSHILLRWMLACSRALWHQAPRRAPLKFSADPAPVFTCASSSVRSSSVKRTSDIVSLASVSPLLVSTFLESVPTSLNLVKSESVQSSRISLLVCLVLKRAESSILAYRLVEEPIIVGFGSTIALLETVNDYTKAVSFHSISH